MPHTYDEQIGIGVDSKAGTMAIRDPDQWTVCHLWERQRQPLRHSNSNYARYATSISVPESCIESAEHVIRCVATNRKLEYQPNNTAYPHMGVKFDRTSLNATTSAQLADAVTGVSTHPFGGQVPEVGKGIMIACATEENGPDDYNMHFGAIVARRNDGTAAVITDVSDMGEPQKMVRPTLKLIRTPDDFRGETYEDHDIYKLGCLYPIYPVQRGIKRSSSTRPKKKAKTK